MFKFGTKIENDELECEVKPLIFKTASVGVAGGLGWGVGVGALRWGGGFEPSS